MGLVFGSPSQLDQSADGRMPSPQDGHSLSCIAGNVRHAIGNAVGILALALRWETIGACGIGENQVPEHRSPHRRSRQRRARSRRAARNGALSRPAVLTLSKPARAIATTFVPV